MKRKWIVFWSMIIGLGIVLTGGIPITIIIGDLNDFVRVNDNRTFIYAPESIQTTENISISSEIGDIDIQYAYPPKDYVAKIEIVLEMSGYNLVGNKMEDFLVADWKDQTSANLTLKLRQDIDLDVVHPFIHNLTVKVFLRADVIFNIDSHLEFGDFHLSIPYGIDVNNIYVNNSGGDITYDFFKCIFNGQIQTINYQGTTILNSIDVRFRQDTSVYYNTSYGTIELYIIQNELIGSNVTCTAEITSGRFDIEYFDSSPDIGLHLEIPSNTSTFYERPSWFGGYNPTWPIYGFYHEIPDLDLLHTYTDHFLFISHDLYENRAKCYYNWTFYLIRHEFDMMLNSTG